MYQNGLLSADLVGGEVVVKYDTYAEFKIKAGALALPVLSYYEAKIASGEMDLVKGTDIDKEVALKVLAQLKIMLGAAPEAAPEVAPV